MQTALRTKWLLAQMPRRVSSHCTPAKSDASGFVDGYSETGCVARHFIT
jgi:hypothetical protein